MTARPPGLREDSTIPGAERGRLLRIRSLQLALAGVWLLDAALQFQPFMFGREFSGTLADSAAGNPRFIADPVIWVADAVAHYPVAANAVFATIQLLIALGIFWRRTVKIALVASIAWSLGVWWLGEGLGGVLTGAASPVSGAPGAAVIYALIAVLVWPSDRYGPVAPFAAARPLGARAARLLWLVLWAGLACLAVQPAVRAPQGLSGQVSSSASGEPSWIAAMDRAALVLAVVTAAAIWVVGQDFGGIFTGYGTDPNSGPPLMLLAACYWPISRILREDAGRPGLLK